MSADSPLLADLRRRRDAASVEKARIQPLLDEVQDYVTPYRRSLATGRTDAHVDRIFDMTAPQAAVRFAGRLQQDLFPPESPFFRLDLGALAAKFPDADAAAQHLSDLTDVVQAFFLTGEFDQAAHEFFMDLCAGTAAMLMIAGDEDRPARFLTVPPSELLLEPGVYGDVAGVFWSRNWRLSQVTAQWPEAELGAELERAAKEEPHKEIEIHQDTIFEPRTSAEKPWRTVIWTKDAPGPLHESRHRVNPWIVGRYYRLSGETWGRGPATMALPTIKTLNTAQKYTLQAAAISMLGIYTAIDDGVFNPDQAPLEPGAVWTVARNGGVLGPSVSRFPDPRPDLSQLVLNELRMSVGAAMMDQSLPPDGAAVRSATEIAERVKRLASDHIGAFGRLVSEVAIPLVRRALEIAFDARLIPDPIGINPLLIRAKIISPLAMAKDAAKLEGLLNSIGAVQTLSPERVETTFRMDAAMRRLAVLQGTPQDLLVTEEERAAMQEAQQKAAMAQQAAAMAAEIPPEIGGASGGLL